MPTCVVPLKMFLSEAVNVSLAAASCQLVEQPGRVALWQDPLGTPVQQALLALQERLAKPEMQVRQARVGQPEKPAQALEDKQAQPVLQQAEMLVRLVKMMVVPAVTQAMLAMLEQPGLLVMEGQEVPPDLVTLLNLCQRALLLSVTLLAPWLVALVAVGLVTGWVRAMLRIEDPMLEWVPRLLIGLLLLLWMAPSLAGPIVDLAARVFHLP